MSSERSSFDPRFDPAFQPGYEGPLGQSAPRLPDVLSPAVDDMSARESKLVAVESAAPGSPGQASPAASVSTSAIELEAESSEAPGRRPNPYFLALCTLAIALCIGGVAVIVQVRALFEDGTENLDYVTVQLLLISGPIAIALAVAIGAALLLVLGLRSRH